MGCLDYGRDRKEPPSSEMCSLPRPIALLFAPPPAPLALFALFALFALPFASLAACLVPFPFAVAVVV